MDTPTNYLNQTMNYPKLTIVWDGHTTNYLNQTLTTFQILSCVIDPLLQMCSMSASRLTTVDMAAYMVNCIHLMNTTLALYEFTDTRLEMLNAQVGNVFHAIGCHKLHIAGLEVNYCNLTYLENEINHSYDWLLDTYWGTL